ncbi:MAG: ABC transporter, partial [Planctomycetes bacterium]|nr:ABC transporter [Planctomycetota bacterium]
AQHNVQQFLKFYQDKRKITILLTSHYMKDVAALCRRVVIIAQGRIRYDGSLAGVIDEFSGYKIMTLLFADDRPLDDLARWGEVIEAHPPKARLRVERGKVAETLSAILSRHAIADVSVEEPPLEEVIADMFSQVGRPDEAPAEQAAKAL